MAEVAADDPESGGGRGDEGELREVVTSLRPFLAHFGLRPTRVAVYMMPAPVSDPSAPRFPTPDMMMPIIRQDRAEDRHTAVLTFVDLLLGLDAPPTVMTRFMEGLFSANHDLGQPNPDSWRVHDIIQLARAYLPVQRALRGLATRVDVQRVVTHLSEQRLLAPELTPRVLETLEENGPGEALLHLLASVYASRVDTLRDLFLDWVREEQEQGGRGGAGSGDCPTPTLSPAPTPSGESSFWLRSVVQSIEANGGDGFRELVPDGVFSPDTWNHVYDLLAYGRRGRIPEDEDTASESGESLATLLPDDEAGGRQLAEERPRLSAQEERLRNMDLQPRQTRTAEYLLGKEMEIPRIMEIIRHQFQASAPNDMDDCSSGVMESLENNSQVPEPEGDGSSSSSVRLHSMRSLHVGRDGRVELRAYQEEVLHWARQGRNTAIFLPTGTGKTFIVLRYMQEHLSQTGRRRVVFLAPKVKLAEQQYHRFQEFFMHATYFRCGRYRSCSSPFSELLDTCKVFVMTPQCLVEAIQGKEVKMTDFSLLVLDECHHVGLGKHAYRVLMGLYIDAKHAPENAPDTHNLPQVIGLTASPGVGPQGNIDSAVSHIRQLCYSMDVERICTVKEHKQQLEIYVNQPQHQIHTCGRRKKDGFKTIAEQLMELVEQSMVQCVDMERRLSEEAKQQLRDIVTGPTLHRGRAVYHHWVCNLEDKLASYCDYLDTYKGLYSMTEMLIVCQRCLVLNEDCDSQYALDYLQEQLESLEDQVPHSRHSTTERKLLDQFNFRIPDLQKACDDPEDYNPKLKMLEEILLITMEKNQEDCACMVFVRSLELTKAIQCWIQRHPELKDLNPGRITGLKRSVTDGGMKRQAVADVMFNFNLGEHKLVVCTSAAEEGLDFQACNLVVRYDYVTSMISMIQTRGRARRMDSQYCLLGTLSQNNVRKEQENLAWERLMDRATEQVQGDMDLNPNAFQEAMYHWQKKDYEARKYQAQVALGKLCKRIEDCSVYRLLCRKCQGFVCMSTDFRLLSQSSRAVVDKTFGNRWKRVERGDPQPMMHNLEKVAKVHCRADNCARDWGILVRYTPTGRLLPVLKIESFFLEDRATGNKIKKKLKWSEAPFHVEAITEEELA
ncbi:antiviral innate immune response receptor RIG-I-like [Babylonia areolata]|uniref:antiviral innate immune response receptor RIG-I-like n=1 Tax=Babylonia areolata TaxID=304850 RepID=UPI003FD2FB2D